MKLIDMHCDTIGKILEDGEKEDLQEGHYAVTLSGMKKAGVAVQFFACFTNYERYKDREGYEDCYRQALQMIECLEKQIRKYGQDIAHAYAYEDIRKNEEEGKISAILTVEEGGILNGHMERLEMLYDRGVRVVTPMWNYENCLGYPNSRDAEIMSRGLKPFGIEAVQRMKEMGMIVDVSHASDGVFWNILKLSAGSVIASHSNCRALCNHPRNLTDAMIRSLSEAGGVAGLNFYGRFLGDRAQSGIEDMTAHILHMIQVGGSEFPAIGTDFDGFDGMEREDIPRTDDMEKLWMALKQKGVTESQLDKIWSENARRVLRTIDSSLINPHFI